MIENEIQSLSPLDGRYRTKTLELRAFFSEYALIKYRVKVEVAYLLSLQGILSTTPYSFDLPANLTESLVDNFSEQDAEWIKAKEQVTNHDVKAVEYFIKTRLVESSHSAIAEWVHFGLTSQDINNTAFPLMIMDACNVVLIPALKNLRDLLKSEADRYKTVSMLSRTHGQAASPTLLGKEIKVFEERIKAQMELLVAIPWQGKFGGAVGNMNAHFAAFPEIDWHEFAAKFLNQLGLQRQSNTTQIEHYDMLAAHFHCLIRIDNILIDLCRDIWTYISMDYFRQIPKAGEIGSSAMPHKVNPIDFENAEGNLGVANALLEHLAAKLPISRLQRDLTDSTVLRNIGVPYGHILISLKSIMKGWSKLEANKDKIATDLRANPMVLAEAIQTILRREHFAGAYEVLKELTRGNNQVTTERLKEFIQSLEVEANIKAELLLLTCENYTGKPNY